MGGILLLLGFLLSGWVVAERLFPRQSRLVRGWLGLSLGLGMMMWFPALFAFFLRFSLPAQLLGLLVALGAAAAARFIPRRAAPEAPDPEGPPLGLIAALVLPLLLLSGYLQYTHILREVDGELWVGQSTYGDLCLHLGIATSLRDAAFPPSYSLIQGVRLGYPFLSDSMVTSMLVLGTPLATAFTLTGTLMMGLVYLGFALFAWELTRELDPGLRRAAVALAFVITFLNGGLGFLYVLDGAAHDSTMLREVFTGFYHAPANMPDYNLRWVNVVCDMMIPQRTLLAGWTMLLPGLYLLALALREDTAKGWVCFGVWAGAMPMVHTHSFLALGLIGIGAGLRTLVARRREDLRPLLGRMLGCTALALVLALPQLFVWTFPQTAAGGSLRFTFNWVNHAEGGGLVDEYFWFWIKNVGPVYLLLVPAAFLAKPRERALAWGALIVYCTAELILFQPNPYDNNKLFYAAFMVMTPLVGAYLATLSRRLQGLPGRNVLAVLLIAVLVLSGAMSLGREAVSGYQLFNASEVAAARFADGETDRDAVFLTGQQHDNPIAALSGRQIVCGTGSYLYFHGISYLRQEMDCHLMLEKPAEYASLLDDYGVDYVYVSSYERHDFDVDEDFFLANCPLAFQDGDVRIFAWSSAARERAENASGENGHTDVKFTGI